MIDDTPLWELLGYDSEEEFVKEDEKEKEQILRDTEQARANEEEVLKVIESGEYDIIDTQNNNVNDDKSKTFDDIVNGFAPVLVGLKGESYQTATKMVFYSILANQLKRNIFTFNGKRIDLRIPIILLAEAGHGKKSYESFIKRTIKELGKEYGEPTSYVPEQFVGKILVDESHDPNDSSRYTQVKGYLGSDFVLIDEAYELLTIDSPNHQEALKYIRTSLDPIGDNEVEKKQVAVPYDYRLRYFPECSIMLMTQPLEDINQKLMFKGSLRRFLIVKINTPIDERVEAVTSGEFLTDTEEEDKKKWDTWIRQNKKLSERRITFTGNKEDFRLIDQYIKYLIKRLYNEDNQSEEIKQFTDNNLFNIKLMIFKMACIRASVEQMNTDTVIIERRNIESAIKDYSIIWEPLETWIRQNMIVTDNKPREWKDDLHGWVMRGLTEKGEILQSELIKIYMKNHEGENKEGTLKTRIKKAIKELKKWTMIEDYPTGNKNEKMLKLKQGKNHYWEPKPIIGNQKTKKTKKTLKKNTIGSKKN